MKQVRFLKLLVYRLCRQYPVRADFYTRSSISTDLETGVITTTKSKVTAKAALLPTKGWTRVLQDLGPQFTRGGYFDSHMRILLVRADYLGTYTPNKQDWVVVEGSRYEIQEIQDFHETAYLLAMRHLESSDTDADYSPVFDSGISFSQTVGVTIV